MDEIRDRHMQARNVTREIELIVRGMLTNYRVLTFCRAEEPMSCWNAGLDTQQLAMPANRSDASLKQKDLWEEWVALEKNNPLVSGADAGLRNVRSPWRSWFIETRRPHRRCQASYGCVSAVSIVLLLLHRVSLNARVWLRSPQLCLWQCVVQCCCLLGEMCR